MNVITLAQSQVPATSIPAAAFWAEFDAAIQRVPAQAIIHGARSRDYRLPSLELRICLVNGGITATWVAETPVLGPRSRLELAQTAQAWLEALAALMLPPPAVSARVQTASSLLSAGFASVSVRGASELGPTVVGMPAGDRSLAMAA